MLVFCDEPLQRLDIGPNLDVLRVEPVPLPGRLVELDLPLVTELVQAPITGCRANQPADQRAGNDCAAQVGGAVVFILNVERFEKF